MDKSQNKRRSFVSQEDNEREEEKESYNSSALPNQKSRYGEKNDVDDQILLEFKKKYQKSLEAIQSFQEILELKKNYTSITHSYYPNKRKETQEISSAKFRSNQSQEQSFIKINHDALYRIDPSKFPKMPVNEPVVLPQLDFSKPPKKSFRIRDVNARGSHGSLSSFQTNLDFHLEPKIQTFETEEAKMLQTPDEIKSPLSAATSSKAIKSLRVLTKSQSTFSTPTKISKKALPINISSQLRNTFRSTERVPEPLSSKPPIPQQQKVQFDKVMGEPYVKIHIKNLANFQAEPLEAYDQALLQKDEDPAHLLKSGINKGFSKFLNARGEIEWRDCEILEYIESEKRFLIRWKHDFTTKKVTRLNLRYATESEVQFQERVTQTLDNRYRSLYMGSYKEMLQEKAKEDTWMNYPMTSLNKIVKLAFGRLQHLDETDTPLILIEQLMNHYKQEVIRFSLESQTFQSDFSTFLKKFTKAYQTIRNVLVTNQDKAIEIFNLPYKDYREYKDWADNSIVDSEEVDISKLRIFNPPSSQKIFYQTLSRYSRMKILQSQDFLVEMYDFVDLSNFLTFNETQMRPRGFGSNQKKVSIPLFEPKAQSPKEIDRESYQTRAILKRKTRIIDVKKVRNEYKLLKPLHADKSTSFVITAFKQLFNKILPKPLDFTAEFMTMVSALIRQLSDIRLFRAFREFTGQKMIRKLQDIQTLKEEFNVDANKIELYLYRVQQCVDELKTDIKILKNDTQEKETLRRVCEFSTIMAHDAIKSCIKNSLEEFITNLEEYYGLLPLPNLSPELEKMLPPSIRQIRIASRKKLFLPIKSDLEEQTDMETTAAGSGNNDKNLIKALIVNIMEDIMKTGTFFRDSFANLETSRLKPIFWLKYFAKQNPKNHPQKQKKSTRQDRARQRLTSRENIYRFDEFKDRLLSDNFQEEDLTDRLRKTAAEMNERYVGRSSLGWYKFGKGQTTHEPHIYDIEEQFKKMIMSVFENFSKLEKIDIKTSFAQTFVNSHGLEDHLINFRSRFDELFKISLLPLLALFNILHNLDFLLVQEKYYVSDIKDLFNESADGNLGTICNEIEELENDLEFVSIRIPKIFNLGIFTLDLTEYLDKIKINIEKYIKELKDFLQLKLDEILNANRILVEKIEDSLSIGAEHIEDYIKLKLFLESDILNSDLESIREGVQLCQQITSYIENFYIIYNKEVLETFYISKSWIHRLSQVKMDAQVQLEASRPRLINELKQKNEEKLKQLERTKIEISNFTNYYDTNHASHYCEKAKEIMGILEGLSEYGTKCNVYEEMLVSKKTDFSTVEVVREQFNKFYLLWEFVSDKWQIKSDIWLNSPFEVLEVRDMEDLIEEGVRLLIILEEKFKNNINILELIRTYIREVNRYKDYLEILKKLKSETWKPRHWEMLWSEMYASLSAKPDPKSVTLKKLLEDKLFTFAQLINTIYKNAQNEYNIEQEIERIEDGFTRIKDLKADTYNVGPQVDIFILKGIPLVMPKLNDYHFTIKNMLANPNYPRTFLDKLNNLEYVLKGIKKILKLCEMIQSKLFIITPIMKHKLIALYFGKEKDHGTTFTSIYTQFKQHLDGVIKRKMNYLISLFDKTVMHETPDMKHDVNGEEVIDNLKKVCAKCNLIIHDFNVVLKQARHTCPRLYLLTDAHLTEFLSITAEPQDIIQGMNWVFTAVKECKIEISSKVPFRLYGVVNTLSENIALHSKILINSQEQDGSNFYLLTLINDLEKGLKQTAKENMLKHMPTFFNNGYQYWNNFKLFRDKNLLFQNLILMNNILFYHDLTIIIAAREYANENSQENFVANKLLMLKANMEHNLAILCEAFSYEKETNWFLLLNQFIFYIKHQLDTLNYIIEANIQSLNTFEYLVLPKLMFEYSSKSITNSDFIKESIISGKNLLEVSSSIQDYNYINERSTFLNHYKDVDQANYNIVLKSFDYKKNYGFDLLPFSEPKVLTPATNRNFLTILSAFATQMGILIHGPHSRGKKEIIKGMAYLLGKETFIVDQFSTSDNFLTQLIFGTIKAGFWILFDNIQNFSNTVLSTMAQQIGMIRHALANGEPKVRYGSSAYDMRNNQNWAFIATYSLSQNNGTASQNIPQNLSSHFRMLNYLHPHLAYILSLNFELLGVQNAAQTANKAITFFQILSNTAENQIFFTSEALAASDLEMLQAVHIQPTINLMNQIIKQLQQMILMQTVLKISTLEIWKAIKQVITDYVREKFVKILLNLFNVIFQSEITDSKDPEEAGEENYMQQVLDTYYKDHQCSVSNDFNQKCFQLFNTIQTPSMQYKTIILVGRTDTATKTSLLETVANAITKAKKINFTLNRVDLDSSPSTLVLGGEEDNEKKQGLIPTFIENALSNSKLAEFTEESSSDLLRHCSKWANPETNDAVIPHNRQCDWLILEVTGSHVNSETVNVIERVLAGKTQGTVTALEGYKIRVPSSINFVLDCENLTFLSPAHVKHASLVHLESNLFSLEQEFNKKVASLLQFGEFFVNIQFLLTSLWKDIIEPILQFTESAYNKQDLLYYFSANQLLNNFMSYFEIFLNECRKMEISFGNITDTEIERVEGLTEINPQKKGINISINITKPTPNVEDKSLLTVSKGDIVGIRHTMVLESPENATRNIDRQTLMIESSCIFCLIWTIGVSYKAHAQPAFSKFLLDKIKSYYRDSPILESTNPASILSHYNLKQTQRTAIVSSFNIFDYCFNVYAQRWVYWRELAIHENQEITCDFVGIRFPTKELSKFNPSIKRPSRDRSINEVAITKTELPSANKHIFVETETSKKFSFFLTPRVWKVSRSISL